jgi:hypothetical protein
MILEPSRPIVPISAQYLRCRLRFYNTAPFPNRSGATFPAAGYKKDNIQKAGEIRG